MACAHLFRQVDRLDPTGRLKVRASESMGLRVRHPEKFLCGSVIVEQAGTHPDAGAGTSGYRATTNPTIGLFSLIDAAEPKNLASPKLKMPPSVATSQ